jgi:hypothetical protein
MGDVYHRHLSYFPQDDITLFGLFIENLSIYTNKERLRHESLCCFQGDGGAAADRGGKDDQPAVGERGEYSWHQRLQQPLCCLDRLLVAALHYRSGYTSVFVNIHIHINI